MKDLGIVILWSFIAALTVNEIVGWASDKEEVRVVYFTSTPETHASVHDTIDWNADEVYVCPMNLVAYSVGYTKSEYTLRHIGWGHKKDFYSFKVDGQMIPKKQLGHPVKSLCVEIDGVKYVQHEQDKASFVEPTDKYERNQLWSLGMNDLDKIFPQS